MIGKRIKSLREEYKLTQAKLAQELGININTLASYESGAREPNISKIMMFAEYFCVSTDYLLGKSPYKNQETEEHMTKFKTEFEEIIMSMPDRDQSTLLSKLIPMFRSDDEYEERIIRQRIFDVFTEIYKYVWCYRATKAQILSSAGVQTSVTGIMDNNVNEKTYMMTQSLIANANNAAGRGHLKMAVDIILPYFDYVCKDLTEQLQEKITHLVAEMEIGVREFAMTSPDLAGVAYDGYATEEDGKEAKEFLAKVKEAEQYGNGETEES